VTFPWTLVAATLLGVWLMAAPAVLGIQGSAADSHHLVGALVLTTAIVSMAELARAGRLLLVAAGAWTALAPWVLADAPGSARWAGLAVGVALIVLALPRGPVHQRYGGADRFIR
jgi:hypothetical protein